MIIYRRLSAYELVNIKTGFKENIGAECCNKKFANTHKYKKGQKYLHFFKNINDIYRIREYQTKPVRYFICSFDVPDEILKKCQGKGKYDAGGYDYATTWVTEYAIDTNTFNCNWLKSYKEDDFQKTEDINSK